MLAILKNKFLKPCYQRLTEFPLRQVSKGRLAIDNSWSSLIPPYVYQTWDCNQFGKTHTEEIEKFRALNRDMNFVLFDRNDLDLYMEKYWSHHPIYKIFQNAKFGPMKADIFRYCILFERGGFYFDINKGASIPIRELIGASDDGLITFETNDCALPPDNECLDSILHPFHYVVQWGIGFTKGHPILEKMIASICESEPFFRGRVFSKPKLAILAFTGPGLFTKVVREELGSNKNIKISQAGIDFNGAGIFNMPGSHIRYLTIPAYTTFENEAIL